MLERVKIKAKFTVDPINKVSFQPQNKGELENISVIPRNGATMNPYIMTGKSHIASNKCVSIYLLSLQISWAP